jgi:PAS domain S-box-containing protein
MTVSSDLYRALFHAAGDAMFVVEESKPAILEINEQASTATGYSREELIGLSVHRLFGQNPLPEHRQPIRFVMKNGRRVEAEVGTTRVEWNEKKLLILILTVREADSPLSCAFPTADASGASPFPAIIGQSENIRDLCRLVGSVAKSDATVLIQGESGVGKEVFAHAIHFHSHRARGPFVRVNCAALTETLLESELFGHVRGAFTGAISDHHGRFKQADGGTLLLDEIGSMSVAGQAKLLRVLQEREFEPVGSSVTIRVNVRVIATSNTDFDKAVAAGAFRQDLYYRLSVCSLMLPPLRDRKEDIPLLAQHLLQQRARDAGKPVRTLSPETLRILMEHDWPGNVRELENAIEYATLVEKGSVICPLSLPGRLSGSAGTRGAESPPAPSMRDKLNVFEKQILLETLVRSNWARKPAATALGIDARNLSYFLRKHNLSRANRANNARCA